VAFPNEKNYFVKETWHVCFMIYGNMSIFPIIVDNVNLVMA
jgi:hypothetical protein